MTPQRGSTEQPASRLEPDSKSLEDNRQSTYHPATSGASAVAATVSAAAAGVANAIPTTSEELQAQLAEAKGTISNLRQQLEASAGLRQRRTEPARDSKEQLQTAVGTQQAPGGVPIHIAALLALFSFLLAYFLF